MSSDGPTTSTRLSNIGPSFRIPNHDGSSNQHTGGHSSSLQNFTVLYDSSGNTVYVPIFDQSFSGLPNLSIDLSSSLLSMVIDVSLNSSCGNDVSQNVFFHVDTLCDVSTSDISNALINPIVDVSYVSVVDGSGYTIVTESGNTNDGSFAINTTFHTTDPSFNNQITENLTEVFKTYNDEQQSETNALLSQIQTYASQINCSQFHGKGTIDDYTELFIAASNIANETKQMELDIDVDGFTEFANAADDLSNLFNGFIVKLQNINIISDVTFLRTIVDALAKIVNLANVFGKFKEVVVATTTVQIPKSTHDTAIILNGVMNEINCAISHINYFVSPTDASLNDTQLRKSQLCDDEKAMISKSVNTINSWNQLCENGISISMTNDPDIQYIKQASNILKQNTNSLTNATSKLRSKLALYNIGC